MLMKPKQFGLRLAELRRGRGLTQDELARLTRYIVVENGEEREKLISPRYIAELEQGRRDPSFSIAVALAKALKVNVNVFTQAPETTDRPGRGRPKDKDDEE